ncbi:heme ABC transporter [Cutibacterium acnes JCM 18918]|nr:heme ABC transporter [Cutibacterium acnes JCM 18918]
MPQFSEFPFSYLVHDIVMMGRSPHPRGPDDAVIVDRAMERTEVTDLVDREVTRLSGGERARVTLAGCLPSRHPVFSLMSRLLPSISVIRNALWRSVTNWPMRGARSLPSCTTWRWQQRAATGSLCCPEEKILAVGPAVEVLTEDNLTTVYRWPIEVVALPGGELVILPRRARTASHDERR